MEHIISIHIQHHPWKLIHPEFIISYNLQECTPCIKKHIYCSYYFEDTNKMPHTKYDKRNRGAYLLPCHWKAVGAVAP
jgi:hypothetical protein